jgi:hypothetical protein
MEEHHMSAPFNVDLAAQISQTSNFQDLVAQGMANNNALKSIADSAMAANQGQFSAAFVAWNAEISQTAMTNNVKFQAISDALGFGIKSTGSTDADNAGIFR